MDNPPDRIYLSRGVWRCRTSKVFDDYEYLLATPERLAAGELRAALSVFMQYIDHSHLCDWFDNGDKNACDCGFYEAVEKIEDALEKARGE